MSDDNLSSSTYFQPIFQAAPAGNAGLAAIIQPLLGHKLLFGAVALSVATLASAVVLQLPKAYTATATAAVQAPPADPLAGDVAAVPLADGAIDTEVDLLQSPAVARQVVAQLGIGTSRAASPSLEARGAAFLRRLHVTTNAHSRVIGLSYGDADPSRAAAALNLVVELTAQEELRRRAEDLRKTAQWLATRQAALGQAATQAEQAEQSFLATAGLNTRMVDNTPTPLVSDEITSTAAALVQAQNDLAAAQSQGAQPAGFAPDGPSAAAGGVLAELEARRAEMEEIYGSGYPALAALNRRIAMARHEASAAAGTGAAGARARTAALAGRVDKLGRNLAALRRQGDAAEAPLAHLRDLQRASDSANTIYQGFVSRASQIADRQSLLQPGIALVAEAVAPDAPSFPNLPKLLAACLALGLLAGAIAAFLRAELTRRLPIASAWALRQPDLPLLARVPQVPVHRRLRGEVERLVGQNPASEEAASMRWLLGRLQQASPEAGGLGSIVVTSAMVAEGKSTICLWLAETIAASGQRVLLIDGDHRHGSLSHKLGQDNGPGLTDWLGATRGRPLPDVIDAGGFDFIAPGTPIRRPFTEIEMQRLRGLLVRLQRSYSAVIIDAAPVLAMAEAEAYASLASHTVLVCHADRTSEAAVQNCVGRLRAAGANLTGLVLSMVSAEVPDRFGEGISRRDVKLLRRYYA